jgi:hypothetical protein
MNLHNSNRLTATTYGNCQVICLRLHFQIQSNLNRDQGLFLYCTGVMLYSFLNVLLKCSTF